MSESVKELKSLRDLCSARGFDLFVYIRECEKLGLASLVADIDDGSAVTASGRVIGYKLGQGLRALFATLSAGNINSDKIKGGPG